MTSLIFGGTYLAYKKAVEHRHKKRKVVNYERWEDLRDQFDDERRRSSMNLDEQQPSRGRLGTWDEELPASLKVERRSYDETRTRSMTSQPAFLDDAVAARAGSETRSLGQRNASEESMQRRSSSQKREEDTRVEAEMWHTPGGMMAELIEGRPQQPQQRTKDWWEL